MRKILSLMIAAVLVLAFSVTASASDYEGLADDLAAIGMFTGTDTGYDLDRAPTRAEVAVMLVRMLGTGTQAKEGYANGSLSHPFSDVPEWAAPSIAYLYTKGLTSGVTDTEFGSEKLCSGQMYCTFMLRALGYTDAEGGDFTYVGALTFAQEKGLVISSFVSDSFTRDELVAVSHQTLRTPVKGSEQTLLENLTAAGAIDKTAAAALTDRENIVKECSDILLQNIADYTALDCSAKLDFTASVRQKAFTSVFMYNLLADLKFIYADTASKADLAFTMVDPISNEQYAYHIWVKDGWVYLQEGENRIKIQIDFEELREIFDESKQQMDTGIAEVGNTVIPSYLFSKVAKTETDEGTLYEFVISPKFINAIFRQAYIDAPVESATASYVINSFNLSETILIKDKAVKKATFVIDVDVESSELEHFTGKLDYVVTVNAVGDDVTIVYPDFSEFIEESEVTETEDTAQTGGKS